MSIINKYCSSVFQTNGQQRRIHIITYVALSYGPQRLRQVKAVKGLSAANVI